MRLSKPAICRGIGGYRLRNDRGNPNILAGKNFFALEITPNMDQRINETRLEILAVMTNAPPSLQKNPYWL
jgi:hypothetical protein